MCGLDYGRTLRFSLDFRAREIDFDKPAPPFPALCETILNRVMAQGLVPTRPDQVTVNEYQP